MSDKIIELIIKYIIPYLTPAGILFLVLLLYPEKIEKLSALLWKFIWKLKILCNFAHKKYIKHDLQSRINEFINKLKHSAPYLYSNKVKINWVEKDSNIKGFLQNGEIILRLKKDDQQETNFVNGAFLFISTSLLFKVKRYISSSQRDSIDLFVASDFFKKQKPSVIDAFLEKYLHSGLKKYNSKKINYYNKFYEIHQRGYFHPVLLQELDFIGQKVFGLKKNNVIISDVDKLIDFLDDIALRCVGDDQTNLSFSQTYSKCAILIIGKPEKLSQSSNYIKYIKRLYESGIESIYTLGLHKNKKIIDSICESVSDYYNLYRPVISKAIIRYKNKNIKKDKEIKQYLVVLRKKEVELYQSNNL